MADALGLVSIMRALQGLPITKHLHWADQSRVIKQTPLTDEDSDVSLSESVGVREPGTWLSATLELVPKVQRPAFPKMPVQA